jgi:hypothetical protein
LALAALIAAYHESAEPGVPRATLPLAGRTVVERQARLAAAAGAAPIIVLVERMTADLSAALDRLRRDRVPVRMARSAEEAAEAVDPNDRLLLIGDGAVADRSQLARLAAEGGHAVLTVPDSGYSEQYERIDGTSRWAGLAAINGALLRDTVAMLRDWDMQSTLLRRALQAGARHLAADGPVAIVDNQGEASGLERRILASAWEVSGGWASHLLSPLERAATTLLMATPVGPSAIGTTAATLTGLGAAAFAYGWLWSGLALMLLATPLDGVALRLARLRMQEDAGRSWWVYLLPVFAGVALIALAYALSAVHGWGLVLLSFTTLMFMIAFAIEAEGRPLRGGLLLADAKGMTWLMLPFAIFGIWQAGLAALFAYAAASFFWAQRQVHARRPK